ncbi:nuclear transport factor 2 family protein [Spirillospora albida]|uniref:nuclear transport factor 2 family protein n=1 Tax=Spirillospora albida TaxID=58123 RepID=UPI0004BF1D99|nr:nuclear transport factor 2 family protein [Spirillospora albida]
MTVIAWRERSDFADLVARYALYADLRKYTSLAGLFTKDAALVLPDPPNSLGPTRTYKGRDGIVEALRALEDVPLTSHQIVGQVFDQGREGGTATGNISCVGHHLSERENGEVTDLVWHLRYTDLYRRDGLTWRFARRSVRIDFIETRPVRRWTME